MLYPLYSFARHGAPAQSIMLVQDFRNFQLEYHTCTAELLPQVALVHLPSHFSHPTPEQWRETKTMRDKAISFTQSESRHEKQSQKHFRVLLNINYLALASQPTLSSSSPHTRSPMVRQKQIIKSYFFNYPALTFSLSCERLWIVSLGEGVGLAF
jgi:hypothetical protein